MDLKILSEAAAALFAEHRLAGWTFGLAGSKRRLGVCKYRRKRIEISEFYATHNPDAAVLDTLLHEIAHALAGPAAKHGPVWQAVAVRIGATPRACDDSPDTVVQPGDWQTTCPSCHRTHHRYKRPRSLSGYRCKCPARSPLVFAFAGDPAREPPVPTVTEPAPARWHASCASCGTVHQRARRPKAGVWRCRCPARGELTWAFGLGEPTAE
ncbi:MAG: SprT-like domain-containing protein [Fimbriiglobus sp.]|jgi:predicted SprT family Zn-dependent metalloprotease|nr:SprT-like domain-containing protein [Fimbriiglobus sp.]